MLAKFNKKGFTLIELLIVIAVLGLLAVVVLIALNPVQQLARTRDSGRRTGVTQAGHALEAYGTSHLGEYVDEAGCGADAEWLQCLLDSGELSVLPTLIDYTAGTQVDPDAVACGGGTDTALETNGYCYDLEAGGAGAIIFSRLESQSEDSKCTDADGTIAAWAVWDTFSGRGGTVCSATPPAANTAGQTFAD